MDETVQCRILVTFLNSKSFLLYVVFQTYRLAVDPSLFPLSSWLVGFVSWQPKQEHIGARLIVFET